MKKVTLVFSILFFIGLSNSFAQSALRKGEKQLNAGFGFSDFGTPIYVGVDFGIHDDITIGPQISYRSHNESFAGIKYGNSLLVLAGNANYHFNTLLSIPREWDLYAGLTLGYYIWSTASGYPGAVGTGFDIEAQIGGRYYFNENWGINLELGGGATSGGKIGITYKF